MARLRLADLAMPVYLGLRMRMVEEGRDSSAREDAVGEVVLYEAVRGGCEAHDDTYVAAVADHDEEGRAHEVMHAEEAVLAVLR